MAFHRNTEGAALPGRSYVRHSRGTDYVSRTGTDEEAQPMCQADGSLPAHSGATTTPQVDRLKSNFGLRQLRQPWCLMLGGALAGIVLVVIAVAAVRSGQQIPKEPHPRAAMVIGHPAEHVRTQPPTAAPKHPVNIGNLLSTQQSSVGHPAEHINVDGAAVGHSPVKTNPQPPAAQYIVGHPPDHTQTVKPESVEVEDGA